MNQGAWYSIQDAMRRLVSLAMFGAELRYVGRTPRHLFPQATPPCTCKNKKHLFQRLWGEELNKTQ